MNVYLTIICILQLFITIAIVIILIKLGVLEDSIADCIDDMKTALSNKIDGFLRVIKISNHLRNRAKLEEEEEKHGR